MKVAGNLSYEKTITSQEYHRDICYSSYIKPFCLINEPYFRSIQFIDKDTYEVQSRKKTIKLNFHSPIVFFVYQNAKRRKPEFYYDCVDRYLDRSDFQLCEMDTTVPTWQSLVKASRVRWNQCEEPRLKLTSTSGFRVLTRQRNKLTIRQPLVCSKKSVKVMASSGFAAEPSIASVLRISSVARGPRSAGRLDPP